MLMVYLFLVCQSLRANTITICQDCEVKSIKEGIALAADFDTLWIRKGTYKEFNILVNKPLVIIGEEHPLIDGDKQGEIIRVASDNVTLDGLHLTNVGVSYTTDYAAIRVVKSQNYLIRNMVLEKLFFGIYLEKSDNGRVFHNKIVGEAKDEYNSGNGIQLWYCNNVHVEGNIVQGTRDGIYLEFSDDITIHNNLSSNNLRYGLHFMFSNNDVYSNNTFEDNGAGVAVMFSKHIRMENNLFRKNWGAAAYGMLLKEIGDAEIVGNTFEENTIGIKIEGSNRITYRQNNFVHNGWAIKVLGACYTNVFENNNFMYNSFDVSYNSNLNDNKIASNYWSSYTGYDLDKDGVGDVPYRPVKLFSYIVNRTPETIVLLRSLFMDIIDFSEKVSPIFTPDNLLDESPLMKKVDTGNAVVGTDL
ncbi:nitrous oxide reductase family maturation protein NosD [Maribacter chungangensis]|uniref:Nitrous oxide reductase family maturation protein NosD n=1 Tax=Maribacter chungangensis TaxID=1069117 RepID=A0ABW3AZA0_9FLAO